MNTLDTIRTDNVGSLLRPAAWKEARVRMDGGLISAEEFHAIEMDCIRKAVAMQEGAGMEVITDGEISRLNFQDSFGLSVGGYDNPKQDILKLHEKRAEGAKAMARWDIPDLDGQGTPVSHRRPVLERIFLARNVPVEEYKRVAPLATKPVKVSLVGPDRVAQRFDHQKSKAIYTDQDAFMADLVALQRKIITGLVAAGCRYVHIDEPGYTAYVDKQSLDIMRSRGEDPQANFARSLKANAEIIKGFPGVTFGVHVCRGNQASMWHREGTYDDIAERMFNELPFNRFLLEYDSERAGSFEPLRFVPKGKVVVLGLISTKVPKMESIDDLKRRVNEATKYLPLEQLALSPQCGFGSDIVGNLITEDDQRRKIELMLEAARQIWA